MNKGLFLSRFANTVNQCKSGETRLELVVFMVAKIIWYLYTNDVLDSKILENILETRVK